MPRTSRVYAGVRAGSVPVVTVDGAVLDPGPSQIIWNHSPDGFECGYGGSGPAQTALAILFDYTGERKKAVRWHQDFKWVFIATAPKSGFQITSDQIEEFFKTRLVDTELEGV